MSTQPPPEDPSAAPRLAGPWSRFEDRHLADYPRAARRLWWLVVGAGGMALLWAMVRLSLPDAAQAYASLAVGLAMVALAAWFPVELPGRKYSVTVADVFMYTLLAVHGPVAWVLAAGLEGAIGTWRTSRRLSSHLASPSAAMAAAAVGGLLFLAVQAAAPALGVAGGTALMLGLVGAAAVQFVGTTYPLLCMLSLKQGRPLGLRDWFGSVAWVGAIALGSALTAAVVAQTSMVQGPAWLLALGCGVLLVVQLLRVSLARQATQRRAQDQRVAQAEHEAEVSQQRFGAAFTHAAVGMAIVNAGGRMLRVNEALAKIVKRPAAQLQTMAFPELLHPDDRVLLERKATGEATNPASEAFAVELRCLLGGGGECWVVLHGSSFDDPGGEGAARIYQLHDISARRDAENRLQHVAYHDTLTGLANRACFNQRLEVVVERSRVDPQTVFAVLFLDMDRFKVINDSLGHAAGNDLLREVARRLRRCVRPGDLVARLGGDEFAVLLEGTPDIDHGRRLAERILEELMQPMRLGITEIQPGASIGLTCSDLGYRTADELLRDADLAMYEAKAAGKRRVAVFDRTMHERIADRLALENDLRHALGDGRLTLAFQPVFTTRDRCVRGFEALARWEHPKRGVVSPTVFVRLAEEAGLVEALTAWVLDAAVAQLARWQREKPWLAQAEMHVNLSARDLVGGKIVPLAQAALRRHQVAAHHLTLEITETMLIERLDVAMNTLNQLQAAGVRLAIDDFGTGYSSLAYLGRLPVQELKIDRSFVVELDQRSESLEILRAVVSLGHALGKRIVAEGVETEAQWRTLDELGVEAVQGYWLGRPLLADQVDRLLPGQSTGSRA